MKKFLILFFFPLVVFSQQSKVGEWTIYSPYRDAIAVTEAGDRIYCAAKTGLFYYNKKDGAVERITKLSGISDIEFSTIKYDPLLKALIIGYKTGNIDILFEDGRIENFSDIKRKSIVGLKAINHIFCNGNKIYFSCSFGIVVFNSERKEFEDTFILSSIGQNEVFSTTVDNSYLFAATKKGLFRGSLSDNLADFSFWTKLSSPSLGLPDGSYTGVVSLNHKIYSSFSYILTKNFSSDSISKYPIDTVFVLEGNAWNTLDSSLNHAIKKLEVNSKSLCITTVDKKGIFFDSTGQHFKTISKYWYFDHPNEFIRDIEGNFWIADLVSGLLKYVENDVAKLYTPNSPFSKSSFSLVLRDKDLYIAAGTRDISAAGTFNQDFIMLNKNNQWDYLNIFNTEGISPYFDIVSLAIDPSDENHIFAGCWGNQGLLELQGRKVINHYNDENTSGEIEFGDSFTDKDGKIIKLISIGGLKFDQNHNLWMINHRAANPIVVKKASGGFKSFAFSNKGFSDLPKPAFDLLIDSYNQKWMVSPNEGLLVFNENETIDNEADDASRLIKFSLNTGSGTQPGNPLCLAEDKEGAMWIGTTLGIAVIYSISDIINSSTLPQQILVEKDGIAQYLLETESITTIAVDGANRKWIGTATNGVFFLSADGTKEISHFTAENSPLLSNEITSIVIKNSGEVFIGTGQGLVSYRGTANEGGEEFKDVYAFPNPVPSGFTGNIAITGLVPNVNVKITDITGKLVYETKSEGGQANWNGLTLNGDKVNSGVYMVFCTTPEGEKTFITKILFFK